MGKWTDADGLTGAKLIDVPPVWLLGGLVLAWGQTMLLPYLSYPFGAARLLGGALVLGGIGLMIWAITAFRRHQTSVVPHQMPRQIITTGPFARSRNPIYLGDLMVLGGAVLWWGAWPSLVLLPVFQQILVRRFIAPEEARMKENFGVKFSAFAEKTPRWI